MDEAFNCKKYNMMQKKKIGLYCGSFNPIHNGHMMVANYALEHTDVDEVWFVPTIQNPTKDSKELLPFLTRCEMINKALYEYETLLPMKVSVLERNLQPPYYTINTIDLHRQIFGEKCVFALILGYDAFATLSTWKDHERLLENDIIICPRLANGETSLAEQINNVNEIITYFHNNLGIPKTKFNFLTNMPLSNLSSTFIREEMKNGKDIRFYIPFHTWRYMQMIKRNQDEEN